MANGPLGGFMPTPPSPGQAPQVKLETSAESRGNFNKFLGTLPKNGAIAPLQTGVMSSSTAPVSPFAGNVNIFQPQMMPMSMAMPMLPPSQPVQMMFNGGEAGDFSDFGGFDDPSDPFGGDNSGQEDTSDSFDANMGLSDQEVQDIFSGGDDQPGAFPTPRPEIINEAVARAENEIFGGTSSDALGYFGPQNTLTTTGQQAYQDAIKGNLAELQDPSSPTGGGLQLASLLDNRGILDGAKSTTAGDISRSAFAGVTPTKSSIDTGAKGLESITDLGLSQNLLSPEVINAANRLSDLQPEALPFSVPLAPVPNLGGGLPPRDTVTGDTREDDVIQEIAERNQDLARSIANRGLSVDVDTITGRPEIASTVDNLLALGREAQRNKEDARAAAQSLGIGTIPEVQGPPQLPDTVFDIDTITPEDDALTTISPDVLSSISREQRIDDANTFRSTVPDAAKIFGGRQIQTTPIDQGVDSIVGEDVVPSLDIKDIQGNINQERVADILNRPEAFKSTFKIGDVEFPNLIATLANKAGTMFDRRLFDGIVSKGLNAVVDPDTGRIIGAKDEFGNLIEGRDLDQIQYGDDNQEPIIRRPIVSPVEEEEEETPPNVIGGGTPLPVVEPVPTVVPSTFGPSTASFTPVGFNTGDLNDLIARITGISSPRRMQEGGIVSAVDNFLSKVA